MLQLPHRPRRLRSSPVLRAMLRETSLRPEQLVLPLFVSEKISAPVPVASMPGVSQLPLDHVVAEATAAAKAGVKAFLLFGIPAKKDDRATGAYAADGIVQRAVRLLKKALPECVIITDVCLCEFMSHGHCGIVDKAQRVDNDASVELLVKTALSHAKAGADIVAPSDMMDGRVGAMREALDEAGFSDTPIMSYAAKFCSAFYGPFRDAAESAPQFGDRRSYQMDPGNAEEALREVGLDLDQGADIVMVKPGLPYLDIVRRVKEEFRVPTAVYNVSGEFSAIKAAAQNGWLDERSTVMEMMTAFRRAGADLIITYWAKDVARWLKE